MSEQDIVNNVKAQVDARVENLGEAAKLILDAGTDIPADGLEVLHGLAEDLGESVDAAGAKVIDAAVSKIKKLTEAVAKLGGVVTG